MAATAELLNCRTAALRLGISDYRLLKLASVGKIRTSLMPETRVGYNADDVEKLRAESGRKPAR